MLEELFPCLSAHQVQRAKYEAHPTLDDLDTDSLVFYTQHVGNLANECYPSPSFVRVLSMYFPVNERGGFYECEEALDARR